MSKFNQTAADLTLPILPGSAGRPALPTIAKKGGLGGLRIRKTEITSIDLGENKAVGIQCKLARVGQPHFLKEERGFSRQSKLNQQFEIFRIRNIGEEESFHPAVFWIDYTFLFKGKQAQIAGAQEVLFLMKSQSVARITEFCIWELQTFQSKGTISLINCEMQPGIRKFFHYEFHSCKICSKAIGPSLSNLGCPDRQSTIVEA